MDIHSRAFTVFLSALLAVALLVAGCAKVPITGRRQFVLISEAQEMKLGEEAYREILSDLQIARDHPANKNLQRVGRRIAEAAQKDQFDWEFTLIQSDEINAWALPGGKIAFYTGILPLLENDAGLAVVMSHEVAHAVARHGAERMSQHMAIGLVGQLVQVGLMGMTPESQRMVLGAYGLGAQLGVALPYSRKHEFEADRIGLELMARAGYDPGEAVAFWERMSALGGDKPPEFLSTHPSDKRRIEELKALLPEARKTYDAALFRHGKGERVPH